MGLRQMAAGAVLAGILAAGCSGGDGETEPTFPENGLTATQVAEHRAEIRNLQAEKDEAAAEAAESAAELQAFLASLSTDCLVAVENYRAGGKYDDVYDDEAVADTRMWCGPDNPRAVAEVRQLDHELIFYGEIVAERSGSIAAHLGTLHVEPPVSTTLG
ncbi:MAG: hypothetical protein KIH63_003825 [Candidatus Saccharibacteria bacterium]|nr:hypothetical protein [Candidatus Saccharibacteria bacterium]